MYNLKNELKKSGIKDYQFDKFKLYNYNGYENFLHQADFSVKIAVQNFKNLILASNKRS